eukprot:3090410-Amphidinium_carterae.1
MARVYEIQKKFDESIEMYNKARPCCSHRSLNGLECEVDNAVRRSRRTTVDKLAIPCAKWKERRSYAA